MEKRYKHWTKTGDHAIYLSHLVHTLPRLEMHAIVPLLLALGASAVPHPKATPVVRHVQPVIEAREKSVAASLTFASDSPSATQSRQMNPNVSDDLLSQIRGSTLNTDRFTVLHAQGEDYWKFDFNPSVRHCS